jgi:hypothetical protein
MDTGVWILLTREIVDATLTAAKIDAGDTDVVHVAHAFGEMFATATTVSFVVRATEGA